MLQNSNIRFLFVLMLAFSTSICFSQNNTVSPYSRYGYGEINDNVAGAYRAMGNVGIGMRGKGVINPMQPASYSAVDSLTFMFDLAASGMYTHYEDALGKRNRGGGNLEYLTMQFPIWKYIGLSLGFMPYTMTGYDITLTNSEYPYDTQTYTGTGGFSEIYLGLSYNFFNWAAIGANVYYLFGNVHHQRILSSTLTNYKSISFEDKINADDVRFRYGVQVFHTFDKHSFNIGGIFEAPTKLNGKYKQIDQTNADTLRADGGFGLPLVYGIGASYTYDNRLTIAVDFLQSQWSQIEYRGEKGNLRDRNKISLGVEYRHNAWSKKYGERMPFRLGLSVQDAYIKQVKDKEFIVSVGMGFPLHNVATILNTSIEYGHRGSSKNLEEHFLRLTLNVAVAERWFFKRKL